MTTLTPLERCLVNALRLLHSYLTDGKVSRAEYLQMMSVLQNARYRTEAYMNGCPQALHQDWCSCKVADVGYSKTTANRMRRNPAYQPDRAGRHGDNSDG